MDKKESIKSFRDLDVYRESYSSCITVITRVLNKLPDAEKYDLKDQLSRSAKAIPRLIAEGYAKRHQRSGFQKYLDDAMAECNETVVRVLYHSWDREAGSLKAEGESGEESSNR